MSMSDPISLRNIPVDSLHLADEISTQTGLSVNDVFRLALASDLLVEVTKIAPKLDGTLGGLQPALLAKALRRHLGSAIDLLMEHGEHPHQSVVSNPQREAEIMPSKIAISTPSAVPEEKMLLEHSLGDDLDSLGIGIGFSEALEKKK